MALKLVTVNVQLGDNEFPIAFSSNALYDLEEKSGMTIQEAGLLLSMNRAGLRLLQLFLWASLEGGRRRTNYRPKPFGVGEVGDLIDASGGPGQIWRAPIVDETTKAIVQDYHPVMKVMLQAWEQAFPTPRKDDEPANPPPPAIGQPGQNS
jgi:hypothetical protein